MKERGCVGALIDGGIRDVGTIGDVGFPVYARYRTPIQSIGRWKVVDHGVPVQLPGATVEAVTVTTRDFILADDGGAIVVPAAVARQVLDRAEALGAREAEIRRAIASGLSLADALASRARVSGGVPLNVYVMHVLAWLGVDGASLRPVFVRCPLEPAGASVAASLRRRG